MRTYLKIKYAIITAFLIFCACKLSAQEDIQPVKITLTKVSKLDADGNILTTFTDITKLTWRSDHKYMIVNSEDMDPFTVWYDNADTFKSEDNPGLEYINFFSKNKLVMTLAWGDNGYRGLMLYDENGDMAFLLDNQ